MATTIPQKKTMLNFCGIVVAILKMATCQQVEIVQCRKAIQDIIIYPHIKF
jgi:hypothetical protein